MKKITVLVIGMILMQTFFLKAQWYDKDASISYISVKQRYTDWLTSSAWGEINVEPQTYTTLDFSANIYKKFRLGALLNLSNQEKRFVNYMLNAGYGNMGVLIEKGRVKGTLSAGAYNELTYSADEAVFDNSFNLLAVYKQIYGGSIKYGVGFLKYKVPADVAINYSYTIDQYYGTEFQGMYLTTMNETFNYIDPNASFEIYGGYFSVDMFHFTINSGQALFSKNGNGLYFFPTLLLGLLRLQPSNFKEEEINNRISLEMQQPVSISHKASYSFGFDTRMELGYHLTGNAFSEKMKYGLALGVEYASTGGIFFRDDYSIYSRALPSTTDLSYWGPFLRLGIFW